jgi:hypothetical protein
VIESVHTHVYSRPSRPSSKAVASDLEQPPIVRRKIPTSSHGRTAGGRCDVQYVHSLPEAAVSIAVDLPLLDAHKDKPNDLWGQIIVIS